MLKRRIIANVVVREGLVVQSIGFNKYLPVGKPDIAIEFLNTWGIDEIILTDITAAKFNRDPDYAMIKKASEKCFVPLTIVGGIHSLAQITKLMSCGADKIGINSQALSNASLITEAAHKYGDQCVIACIDGKKNENGFLVYDHLKKQSINLSVKEHVKNCQEKGAGEIFINSVDRDGSYEGFDIALIKSFEDEVSIPIIASGGAKNYKHFDELFGKTSVSAGCAANFFHFTEHSVITTKSAMFNRENIRLETSSKYKSDEIGANGRLVKKSDIELNQMLFVKIEKEVI